jgi:hypothetical protein
MADSTSSTAAWGEERPSAQQVRPFDGRSFPVWKARIRAKLQAARLLYVLDEPQDADPTPSSSGGSSVVGGDNKKTLARSVKKQDQQEADEQRAYAMLILALDDNHVAIVTSETEEGDVRAAWRVLLRMYERETTASKHQLRGELHRIKLNAGECIDAYKARVLHLVSRLRCMKESVSEGEQIYCMLEGLPKGYEMLRQAMEVQEGLTFEQICSHLRDAQEKLRVRAKEEQPARDLVRRLNAVTMESTCALCKTKGHWIGQCARRKGTKPGECFVCGSAAHGWRACPQQGEQLNAIGADSGSEESEVRESSWLEQADALVKRIREEKYQTALIPSARR